MSAKFVEPWRFGSIGRRCWYGYAGDRAARQRCSDGVGLRSIVITIIRLTSLVRLQPNAVGVIKVQFHSEGVIIAAMQGGSTSVGLHTRIDESCIQVVPDHCDHARVTLCIDTLLPN